MKKAMTLSAAILLSLSTSGCGKSAEMQTVQIIIPDSVIEKYGIEISDCQISSIVECTIKTPTQLAATAINHTGLKSLSFDENNVLLESTRFPSESMFENSIIKTAIGYAPTGTSRIEICMDLALLDQPNCKRIGSK